MCMSVLDKTVGGPDLDRFFFFNAKFKANARARAHTNYSGHDFISFRSPFSVAARINISILF